MSYNLDLKNGGEIKMIKPSARKSIHSVRIPQNSEMNERDARQYTNAVGSDDGHDETDNILSKPLATADLSHIPVHTRRRRSLAYDEEASSDELSDGKLSKSLPTNFHFKTHSSEKIYSLESSQSSWDQSYNSCFDARPNPEQQSFKESYQSSGSESPVTNRRTPKRVTKSGNGVALMPLASIAVVLFAVLGWWLNIYLKKADIQLSFKQEMDVLTEKYNLNEDSMLQVQEGIKTIHGKEIGGSFIFVYNSKMRIFDEHLFNSVVEKIALTTARYLRNDSASVRHLVLDGSSLPMRDHNELLRAYERRVGDVGVMLVKDIPEVPANLAMAFHYYCDEFNPLIKRSAIFFTLDMAGCANYSGEGSIEAQLEACLAARWRGLRRENVGPLLARVVSIVVDIT